MWTIAYFFQDLTQSNKVKIIARTSGSGVGKSSIIRCLRDQGYSIRENVFTQLFAQVQNQGHFNDQYFYSKELIHRGHSFSGRAFSYDHREKSSDMEICP